MAVSRPGFHYRATYRWQMIYWSISAKNIRDVDVDVFMCHLLKPLWPNTPDSLQYRFLRQEYSWGPLLITKDTFTSIRESCNAFPALNDHISSFAFKTSDSDEHFATCDRKVFISEGENQTDHGYHGTWFLCDPMHVIVNKTHLGYRRIMLSASLSSAARAKEWVPVLYPSAGNLPTLRSCDENI